MTVQGIPAADWHIDVPLVRDLLAEQHPDLAHLPIEPFASGWDNKMFRLGDAYVVRMPRGVAAVSLLAREQRWLPELAPRLPLPIPAPVRAGMPTSRYPAPWSVLPWLRGVAANEQPCRANQAEVLARFLRRLHVPAAPELPRNPVRGIPLRERASVIEERLERVARKTQLISAAIRAVWREALEAPLDTQDTWVHGDLHARNVLVDRGRLSGVIDWGDLCRGDRATDLAAFWMLLPSAQARAVAIETYGDVPEGTWARARGWAVSFGAVLVDAGITDDPSYALMGEHVLRQIAAEPIVPRAASLDR
jgi:aminoglycoside phosphotransferase (APT) family kinase protein